MKRLILTLAIFLSACHHHAFAAEPGKLAGKWLMTMETPHGAVKGPFVIEQDGVKLKATFQTQTFGTLSATGSLDGQKVSFSLSVPEVPQPVGFSGTLEGSTMSGKTEMGGNWSASRETAKSVSGTVTDFRVASLELAVKPDDGPPLWLKFGPETEVVEVAPGETDLSRAKPARITDIARADRVLVSFVTGMVEARRIVVVSETSIQRRDVAEKLDWATRGMSGLVSARDGSQITLETRTPQGTQHLTVVVTAKTAIRRYAPDSVKFADAGRAKLSDIAVGDQVRTRGDKSEDGSRLTADDVVFGTFLTTIGRVSSVNREKHEMVILDAASKKPLTVRLTVDTHLKKMPDMHEMAAGRGHGDAPVSVAQMLDGLPAGSIDDLKAGSSVVVTSTRGAHPDRVTGIMVIANVDGFLEMAQQQAPGASPLEAINKMHGGILGGPAGISLPGILQ